jgi:signal transduction histidine kinase
VATPQLANVLRTKIPAAPGIRSKPQHADDAVELLKLAAAAAGAQLPPTALDDAAAAARQLPPDARLRSIAFNAWLIATLAVEGSPVEGLLDQLAEVTASELDLGVGTLLVEIHAYAAADPRFAELPPSVAVTRQLALCGAFADCTGIAIFRADSDQSVHCVARLGGPSPTRRQDLIAKSAIMSGTEQRSDGKGPLLAVPIIRWQEPVAALVARLRPVPERGDEATAAAIIRASATRLAQILERELLLTRSVEQDEMLTATADRRLVRLGYDLHDGPTQELIVLAGEVERLRKQMSERGMLDPGIDQTFEDLHLRISATDTSLRELAHSLQPQTLVEQPLDVLLERELTRLRDRFHIGGNLELVGDAHDLTATQRITIFRTVQEALTNVREHSSATAVQVYVVIDERVITVRVQDNGVGFNVTETLEAARQRGRLGVTGLGERVRLLGGIFTIDSKPGGPTTVRATIPRWRPATVEPVEQR